MVGDIDTNANPTAIPEYLDYQFKQKAEMKKHKKMMGEDDTALKEMI